MQKFINISNHPISKWDESQKRKAGLLGGVEGIDIPFPNVPPEADVLPLARELVAEVQAMGSPADEDVGIWGVHVMGEQTLCFPVVAELLRLGYNCLASTTERKVIEKDGVKTSMFSFVKFRRYAYLPVEKKPLGYAVFESWGERDD